MVAPPSYRLDSLAVTLATRLEATRRAHLDDPEAARGAFERVVGEASSALARDCREMLGDEAQARLIEHEAVQTLLPRYTRIALAQNKVEAKGFGGPLGDGPVGRALTTLFALALVGLLVRYLPGITKEIAFFGALTTPFVPELGLWWSRRSWQRQLQELADDMGRVQDASESLPSADPVATRTEGRTADPDPTPDPDRAESASHVPPRQETR